MIQRKCICMQYPFDKEQAVCLIDDDFKNAWLLFTH